MLKPILDLSRNADVASCRYDFLRHVREGRLFHVKGKDESPVFMQPGNIGGMFFRTRDFTLLHGHIGDLARIAPVFVQYCAMNASKELEPDSLSTSGVISSVNDIASLLPDGHISWKFGPVIFFDEEGPERVLEDFRILAEGLSGKVRHCSVSFYNGRAKMAEIASACQKTPFLPFSGPFLPLLPDPFTQKLFSGLKDIASKSQMRLSICGQYGREQALACGLGLESCFPFSLAGITPEKTKKKLCACHSLLDFSESFSCFRRCVHCEHAGADEEGDMSRFQR